MLTIYNIPISIYTAKLRVVLRHKGLEWEELPPPGGYRSDAYRKIVPSGNIPTMLDGDVMLSDSEAIAEYLNEKHPDPAMLPEGVVPRAKAREKGRFHDTRLEPSLRAMYPLLKTREAGALEAGFSEINRHLAALDLLLSLEDWSQERLWLCDAGFAVTLEWLNALEQALSMTLEWPASVKAYQSRIGKTRAVQQELDHYRPAIKEYLHQS